MLGNWGIPEVLFVPWTSAGLKSGPAAGPTRPVSTGGWRLGDGLICDASLTIHSDKMDHDLNKLSNQDYLISEAPADVLFLKAKYMFGSV